MSRLNFENELRKFKQNSCLRLVKKKDTFWELCHILPSEKGKKPYFEFYAIDKTQMIGKGSFGGVYSAYPVCAQTGDVYFKERYVVKKIDCSENFTKEMVMTEVAILAQCYKTDVVQHIYSHGHDTYFIFTKYVPGKPLLCDKTQRIHEGVATLSFVERLNLIVQLAIQVNGLHHARRMRDAYAHFDIKGNNVLFHIDRDKDGEKILHISLIDFGAAKSFSNDDPEVLYPGARGGTYSYFPVEYLPHQERASAYQIGLKQDLYALTPLVAVLLGAKRPFNIKDSVLSEEFWRHVGKFKTAKERKDFNKQLKAHIRAPYALEDMLGEDVYLFQYPQKVRQLIVDFVNRMQSHDYHKRPDSNEFLEFFLTMLNFFKVYNDNQKLEHYIERLSKCKERVSLYKILKEVADPKLMLHFWQWLMNTGRIEEAKFITEFSHRYKAQCRFSFLGNIGRSELGEKIMAGREGLTFAYILEHAAIHSNGQAFKVLCNMRNDFFSLEQQDDDELLIIPTQAP